LYNGINGHLPLTALPIQKSWGISCQALVEKLIIVGYISSLTDHQDMTKNMLKSAKNGKTKAIIYYCSRRKYNF
jgi:hypothetical protein